MKRKQEQKKSTTCAKSTKRTKAQPSEATPQQRLESALDQFTSQVAGDAVRLYCLVNQDTGKKEAFKTDGKRLLQQLQDNPRLRLVIQDMGTSPPKESAKPQEKKKVTKKGKKASKDEEEEEDDEEADEEDKEADEADEDPEDEDFEDVAEATANKPLKWNQRAVSLEVLDRIIQQHHADEPDKMEAMGLETMEEILSEAFHAVK